MRSKKPFVCLAAIMCATMAFAQFEQFGGQPPQRESADVRATRKAQQLRDTLKLDCDQFNSVYKVYYNEYSAMEQQMMPQGGPPQGGGPGGMPPGGGGGMPPQGFGGGGGMPPMGANGQMSAPPSQSKELTEEQLQKQQEKRQKKMKKILTEQQYELWFQMDTIQPQRPPKPEAVGSIK